MTMPWSISEEIDILAARSYEFRSNALFQQALKHGWNVKNVFNIGFQEYDEPPLPNTSPLDQEAHKEYWKQSSERDALVETLGVTPKNYSLSIDSVNDTKKILDDIKKRSSSSVLLIDISCLPRFQLSEPSSISTEDAERPLDWCILFPHG